MVERRVTDATLLREIGQAIDGEYWMLPMAKRRGVADRTVRRWANEETEIPAGIWPELRGDLEAHRRRLDALIKKLPR